ncbi:hypothetical protein [Iodobacter fluviatilis]|uniref:Uncharacterized protein n=1 Tax=Iodobacter fluviatilis TaxID=537 RepID=A0A7G3G4N3_9NEIS|nr:hypothetical protein [Iodobacter fluviatilis]QBC42211.1 hypothetical protein C1H71_00645 [Iodobacter fluviatilis]
MKLAPLAFLLISCGISAANLPWQTKSSCGGQEVIYSVSCKAVQGDLNECVSKSQALKYGNVVMKLPFFSEKDLVNYRKAGTIEDLFVKDWSCVKYENKHYLRIYYMTYGGHGDFDEKIDYFADGAVVEHIANNKNILTTLERSYVVDVKKYSLNEINGRFSIK